MLILVCFQGGNITAQIQMIDLENDSKITWEMEIKMAMILLFKDYLGLVL